jgi:hypothetical protein
MDGMIVQVAPAFASGAPSTSTLATATKLQIMLRTVVPFHQSKSHERHKVLCKERATKHNTLKSMVFDLSWAPLADLLVTLL